jgi:hypothetical protein
MEFCELMSHLILEKHGEFQTEYSLFTMFILQFKKNVFKKQYSVFILL